MTDVRSAPTTARNPYLPTAARWLAGILIVLVIAAGATYSYRQQAELRRGRAEWEAEVARIRESGQPLTAAELQAYGKIPDGEDLTQLYLKALAGCTSDYKAAGDLPIVGSGNDDIPMPPQPWPQLEQAEAYLKQYRGPLQDLSELGERRGAMRIDTEKIQQLQDVRSAIRLLQLQCAVRTHRQDYQGAADSLIAMHRLPEALRYQVTGNAQVFRVAFSRVASWQVVPLVQDPEFPQSELQRVQEALRETDWQNALLLSCLSERSRNYELVQQPVSAAFPQAEKEFRFSANFILLRSRPGDAARVLRIHSDYVDAARSDLPTVIASFQGVHSQVRAWSHEVVGPQPRGGRRPETTTENIGLSYTGSYQPHSFLKAATEERAAFAVLAIERYRRQRGQLPDTLDDLVPDYLSVVPLDPFNGYPLRLVKRNGGYAVYGVGMDLVDNVGDVESQDQHTPADEGLFVPAN